MTQAMSVPVAQQGTTTASLQHPHAYAHSAAPQLPSSSSFYSPASFPRERGILDIHAGPKTVSMGTGTAAYAAGAAGTSLGGNRVFHLFDPSGQAEEWRRAIMAARGEAIALLHVAIGAPH